MKDFELWLEFEHVDFSESDIEDDFCNIMVDLPDGRRYGVNVWTYKFLNTAVIENKRLGENLEGLYLSPPDLFVKELSRECIEKVISDILKRGNIEDILNPSVLG